LDFAIISVHGSKAKTHDGLTRAPGSFKHTVQGIRNLLDYRDEVTIELRVVIHRLKYKHLPTIARFISKEFKGIHQLVLFPIDIIGNANINRKELIAKVTDIKPYLERGLDILEKSGFESSLYHIPFCIIDEKYWKNVAGMSVEEVKVTFKHCDGCIMRENCPGIWKTYAFRVGTDEFKPIKSMRQKTKSAKRPKVLKDQK
jgi:sulfatase maturation enzyme AslB (radical SAM superfamily)